MNYFFSMYKNKNEGSWICAKMNEPREHYAKLNKADKGGQILYVESRIVKLIEPSSNKCWYQELGGRGNGILLVKE